MLQTDLDAATAKAAGLQEDLDEANAALTTAQTDLMTANGLVTDLDDQLETATGMVTALDMEIGDEDNPAPDSVRGMLAQANTDLEQARTDLQTAMDNSADEMKIDQLTKAVTAAETMRDSYKGKLDMAILELDGDGTSEGLRAKVTRLEDELDTANDDITDLREAVRLAGVSTVIAMANSEYVAAKKAYDDLMAVYGTADADVDEAKKLVEAANTAKAKGDAAHTVAGSGTVAQMTAAADNVAAAASAASAAAYELRQATTTAAAMPYAMAIMMQPDTPEVLDATATRTGNAVMVSAFRGTTPALIAKGSASDAGQGWYRANVANEDGDQTAIVYTNIENTMEKFNVEHDGTDNSISVSDVGVLTLANAEVDTLKDLMSAAAFPGASPGSLTLDYDGTDEKPSKFDGTFDGVPGSYNCDTTTTCTATADSDGELTVLMGTWTFIPAYLGEDGMSDVDDAVGEGTRKDDLPVPSVAIDDTEYEHFGWWTMVDEDGVVAFQTFFGGTDTARFGAHTGSLVGTATYNSPLKKASLTGFHATAKHIAAKAVSPSSETMRTI